MSIRLKCQAFEKVTKSLIIYLKSIGADSAWETRRRKNTERQTKTQKEEDRKLNGKNLS